MFTFDAPQPVPADLRYATFEIVVEPADKLVVGISLTVEFFFSPDGVNWIFANSTVWNSYGPGGLTVTAPDGTVLTNPNPKIQVGLSGRAGQQLRGTLTLTQAMRVGTVVSVTN